MTTALAGTADQPEPVLLGSWCAPYGSPLRRSPALPVVPYHWDDRRKLLSDYHYLKDLHGRVLTALASTLNAWHGTRHSQRYWRILIDPWLLSYVAVMFDRWECVQAARQRFPVATSTSRRQVTPPPAGWTDFVEQSTDDAWNHAVFLELLDLIYGADHKASESDLAPPAVAGEHQAPTPRVTRRRSATLSAVQRAIARPGYVSTINAGFPRWADALLSLSLGQVPRMKSPVSGVVGPSQREDAAVVRRRTLVLDTRTPQEEWMASRVLADLPSLCLEDYKDLVRGTQADSTAPSAIVASGALWSDTAFKVWCAEHVERGARLITCEHGGSLPAPHELFDFEEDIADTRITWFQPYHPKHRQLPAPKLAGRVAGWVHSSGATGDACLVVAVDMPRYAYRAHFYPIAGQVEAVHDMTVAFANQLARAPRGKLRVKPYPAGDAYRNTVTYLRTALGADALVPSPLPSLMASARVIVCTYPETTFSEAMATGRPVVLVYPSKYYERHPIVAPLLADLRQASIVFEDPVEAAVHVNRIWADPYAWWNAPQTRGARDQFLTQALGNDGHWLRRWRRLLRDWRSDSRSAPTARDV